MATIKSFTSLKQSKKLAEILPLESADLFYIAGKGEPVFIGNKMVAYGDDDYDALGEPDVLCWSLAALFCVLPILDNRSPILSKTFDGKYRVVYHSAAYEKAILTIDYDNPVDACYKMITKLHELNLL